VARKVITIIIVTVLILSAVLYASFDSIIEHYGRKGLAKVEKRIGLPLVVETIKLKGYQTIVLTGVRVGPADAPFLSIQSVEVDLESTALRRFKIQPREVRINRPELRVTGDGTPKGALKGLKALLPPRRQKQDSLPTSAGLKRPTIIVNHARFTDMSGVISMIDGQGELRDGSFFGHGTFQEPDVGKCQFTGDRNQARVACAKPYNHWVGAGFRVEASAFEVTFQPILTVRLAKVRLRHLAGQKGPLGILSGIRADVSVSFPSGEAEWPIELNLELPGGGRMIGQGKASPDSLELSAKVTELRVGRVQKSVSGTISGQYRIQFNRRDRVLNLWGDGRLVNFTASHPALSEVPVGPFDLSFGGRIDAEFGRSREAGMGIRLTDAHITLGRVRTNLGLEIEKTSSSSTLQAFAHAAEVDADVLREAIPPGLIPALEPINAHGRIGFRAALFLDFKDYDATRLKIEVPRKRFRITQLNPNLDFDRLRHAFKISHVLKTAEGLEIRQSRLTGPMTGGWVSLDEMPALLPTAVRSQEDWGFYKHAGVSGFHLRGSLVSNLKSKRFRRGGSTMTMQLARNLFLSRHKTLSRKLQEVILAWLIEERLDKDEIMAIYLNVVELGPDIYGIGEAAKHYFDKLPAQLTAPEIAWIVRLLPGPRPYYKSFQLGKLIPARRNRINSLLKKLVDREALSPDQATPIGRSDLWPNGTGGRPKKTENGIPIHALKAARRRAQKATQNGQTGNDSKVDGSKK
jgi:hypothetical protein